MKIRFVIIDERIHVLDEGAIRLRQRALWAKELRASGANTRTPYFHRRSMISSARI
jgi:hypothetical protein